MEAIGIYLLKSSGILFLFFSCYTLFLRKETLFEANRWFLLTGILTALFLPLAYYTETVIINSNMGIGDPVDAGEVLSQFRETAFSWPLLLLGIYILGTIFFMVRLALELYQVKGYVKNGKKNTEGHFIHVQSSRNIQPFSFFNYIIYNPKNHSAKELELILAHEQVHARQRHSIDILLMEVILLIQWFNPFVWFYKSAIKQNLEFMADTQNEALKNNKKQYQYLLLKQSIGQHTLSIINPFFNSLIKKRIVMINQIPSHRIKVLKALLILPFLALFFVSFNVRTEYRFPNQLSENTLRKKIEVIIDKDTSNEELEGIKKDLKNDGVDFSYTVVHNEKKEIIDISIQVSGKSKNGGTFNNTYNASDTDDVIEPLVILIDPEHNLVSIGSKGTYASNEVHIDSDDDHIWISSGDKKHKKIRIEEENGKKVIFVNGKEVKEEDLEDIDIRMEKSSNIFIHSDSDDEHDIRVISDSDDGNGFFFIDSDGDKDPLFIVDGKKSTSKKVKRLNPDDIESIDITKGEKAIEKYGEKAKDGVVVITTKEN